MRTKQKELTKTARISIMYCEFSGTNPDDKNEGGNIEVLGVTNLNKNLGNYLYYWTKGGIDTTGYESDMIEDMKL